MFSSPVQYQLQQFYETGKFLAGTNLVDDAQLLNREPGRIARIVIYAKTFLWGMQIFYADGSTSGLHTGFMEPENPPVFKELVLDPNEYIQQISGYAGDYVGALHIKTNFGKTLDIGKTPIGTLFSFQNGSFAIQKLVYGYSGYINYIGVLMGPPPSMSSYIPAKGPLIEFTSLAGCDSPDGTAFNDYDNVVLPALRSGFKVRISRIKVYQNKEGIIGIKPVYLITDLSGKTTKKEMPHRSKKVGFFTSRKGANFDPTDYPAFLQGKSMMFIKKLRIINSKQKTVIECGKDEGAEFGLLPAHSGPIIAFAGSVGEYLYTLRAYSLY